jgi:hypothetical protein
VLYEVKSSSAYSAEGSPPPVHHVFWFLSRKAPVKIQHRAQAKRPLSLPVSVLADRNYIRGILRENEEA